jgi:3'(2'), 5'-bisphosphate nucleotidase
MAKRHAVMIASRVMAIASRPAMMAQEQAEARHCSPAARNDKPVPAAHPFSADDDLARLILTLCDAAEAAGRAIMHHYGSATAHLKADGSPVTAADHAAEAVILQALASLCPNIPAVSEEQVAAGRIPDISGGCFWLIDPLDGTKEFLRRNGEFTVNIGLILAGTPRAGIIHTPALGETYYGCGTKTARRRRHGGAWEDITCRPPPATGLTAITSRSHADAAGLGTLQPHMTDTLPIIATIIAGSSLKFCRVAEGNADLYLRTGPTCEWDIAAGHALLLAAGGEVTALDGAPLRYGKAPDFLNPPFIARATRHSV